MEFGSHVFNDQAYSKGARFEQCLSSRRLVCARAECYYATAYACTESPIIESSRSRHRLCTSIVMVLLYMQNSTPSLQTGTCIHTAIYGPTTERARFIAASAHYYCMILELQHLIGALTSFGPAADYPDSGDASATHSHFGHPFETLRIGDSRCADHGAIDPNSWSRTVPKSVGTDEAIAALFPSQYLMHSKTDTQ
jgi:hypothetical protein